MKKTLYLLVILLQITMFGVAKSWAAVTFLPDYNEETLVAPEDENKCMRAVNSSGLPLYHHAPKGCDVPEKFDNYCPHDHDWITECYCPAEYNKDCSGADECPGSIACRGKYSACKDNTVPSEAQLTPCQEPLLQARSGSTECGTKYYVCRERTDDCYRGGSVNMSCDNNTQDKAATGEITELGNTCYICKEKPCTDTCAAKGLSDSACPNGGGTMQTVCGKTCYSCPKECDGQLCPDGRCISKNECCQPCLIGEACVQGTCSSDCDKKCPDGSCVKESQCCSNKDCAKDETCVNHICTPPDCEKKCLDGKCIKKGECCSNERKCSDGKCVDKNGCCASEKKCNNKCIDKNKCCDDKDCKSGESCEDGICKPANDETCKKGGYTVKASDKCKEYEKEELCPTDKKWKKCIKTCASVIKAADPSVSINADNKPANASIAVVVDDISALPNSPKIISRMNYARNGVKECANSRPTINANSGSLDKNIENVIITGMPSASITGTKTWNNSWISTSSVLTINNGATLNTEGQDVQISPSSVTINGTLRGGAARFTLNSGVRVNGSGKFYLFGSSGGQLAVNGTISVASGGLLKSLAPSGMTIRASALDLSSGSNVMFNGSSNFDFTRVTCNGTMLVQSGNVKIGTLYMSGSGRFKVNSIGSANVTSSINFNRGAIFCLYKSGKFAYRGATKTFNENRSFRHFSSNCDCKTCTPLTVTTDLGKKDDDKWRFNKHCPRRTSGCKHNACWSYDDGEMRDRCGDFWTGYNRSYI